jgi:hypothetical protein
MRVRSLYRPHNAYQGHAEQARRSDQYAPICRYLQHEIPECTQDTNFEQSSLRRFYREIVIRGNAAPKIQ